MRGNACLEDEAEQQIKYLTEATGLSMGEVLRASVQRSGLGHFPAFIGQNYSGCSDVAGSHKAKMFISLRTNPSSP